MTHLQRIKILKWVSSNFIGAQKSSLSLVGSLFYIAENPRFYRTKRIVQTENLMNNGQRFRKFSNADRKEAQNAVLEYLQCTRSLQFIDAENLSKNSPYFLDKLLAKIEIDEDIGQSISRFLCYHPINEFEPFFESLGLQPHEYSAFLPRNLMFLSDDALLLENYHVLYNYGIARNKIGKILKEAMEVFGYDYGVLALKLKAFEDLGLHQSFITKVAVCSPSILVGEAQSDFIKVLEILKKGGVKFCWIEEHLSEKSSYNWSQLLVLLNLFIKAGYNEEQLGGLIIQNPWILCKDSLDRVLLLIGFLLKFGSTPDQIYLILLQLRLMQVEKFFSNLRNCFHFLNEIKMEARDISKLFRWHPLLLGSCTLSRNSSLETRKQQIYEVIGKNQEVMEIWLSVPKIGWLPGENQRSYDRKTKFLLDIGFLENSCIMERALDEIRGRGRGLQERFDCLVRAGLDIKDVCEMVKVCPQILNQPKDVLEKRISFLRNDMGYPVSSLVNFPYYLKYKIRRVKLRLSMYNWLKDQGKVDPTRPLSSLIATSDDVFIRCYVNRHPRGPEIWQDLRNKFYVNCHSRGLEIWQDLRNKI